MADRIRDRTLVLRILSPTLLTELNKKLKNLEDDVAKQIAEEEAVAAAAERDADRAMGMVPPSLPIAKESRVMDLNGVTCFPKEEGSTQWSFRCDKVDYPARLVNLPCPVEVLKTHDHHSYYKCVDVGQILLVYENQAAMDEAENAPGYKVEGFPSYYHSGLTPPMKRVVQRRFAAREHKSVAPPKADVMEVEKELKNLIATISRDTSKNKKNAKSVSSSTADDNKIIEEIVDDIVDYEPWMDENGQNKRGIDFDEKDDISKSHPELWLDPQENEAIAEKKQMELQKDQEQQSSKKKKDKDKSKSKSKNKKQKSSSKSAAADTGETSGGGRDSTKKKKKAAKKKGAVKDEISQAAEQIAAGDDGENLEVLDGLFSFDNDDGFDFN
eukprot:CAMPEP_0172491322 /NCGR_PEP_ID=MMETSP1066-20121228/22084_1 /TAXON_ID=671091 /ORGANISM="Coscinodiscus wailesii, Strain CCMP2513" /LENGTH=384 /DNA_ID=CAMNT_0013260313 /DNA_START=44 /DNA_END=1198 /DNA_ORIENTATION=-